jgi:hypothetical protein
MASDMTHMKHHLYTVKGSLISRYIASSLKLPQGGPAKGSTLGVEVMPAGRACRGSEGAGRRALECAGHL